MSNIYDAQLDRMKSLMAYGINESTAREGLSSIERQEEGADGKTYGIIREGKKFYIKSAPKKDTQLVAEDFDYIGGFMNKKANEYLTYPIASKQFELKLMSINEACNSKRPVIAQGIKVESAEWQINETREMRAELDRFGEIVNNVSHILKEEKDGGFTMNHTLPEAPAKNPSDDKVNAPFTDTAVAKLDKDLKDTETNPEKAGGPYTEDGKVSNEDMKSDKTPGNGADDGTYCEAPKYVDTGVAGQHPKGGKVVKVSESKSGRTFKLTEEQVLAWSKSKDFIDKTNGTEIGDKAPYTEEPTQEIHEDTNVVHNTDNQNSPTPGTNEKGDSAPFTEKPVNEEAIDVNDVAGMGNETDVPFPEVTKGAYEQFEEDFNDWLNQEDNNVDADLFNGIDNEHTGGDFDDLDPSLVNIGDNPYESKKRKNRKVLGESTENGDWHGVPGARFIWHGEWADPEIEYNGKLLNYWDFADFFDSEEDEKNASPEEVKSILDNMLYGMSESKNIDEAKLDDFGKHPAYQKKPMTTPPNKEVLAGTADKDWNDDSAKGEQPFGQKIGSSAPYTEDVVEKLTDAIMRRINSNKKKV